MKYKIGWKQLNGHNYHADRKPYWIMVILTLTLLVLVWAFAPTGNMEEVSGVSRDHTEASQELAPLTNVCTLDVVGCESEILAITTAFNTFSEQTDESPCIAASGANICGRTDVVTCPRVYEFGSKWLIDGKEYICEDRTSLKYDCSFGNKCIEERWDISFDKNIQGAINWGKRELEIIKL